ncbi:mannose-6-phosphate isomerase [Hamadaea flava]|uniref:mannose-6-phosphate isomerase n=1 Tax=Hamadaea flava TaxID=1742688 RepID=A0ABV8M1S0_9ACTN|nr:mannose-6-phosphate isomerase, class I [Hamadaea flava]MCP2326697.1 mannose-6-phosphate isomerase [Hamadaea flava]
MRPLASPIQPYAWGSRTALATLQGRSVPSAGPEAELWIGAHPSAPARLPDGRGLDEAIAADPRPALGPALDRFGPRLPYLLKVLAAEQPLSLQAHPDLPTAQAAFAAGHPSYVDANHKPELLVAATEFDALCGFQPASVGAARLAGLQLAKLDPVVRALAAGDLRSAVEQLLTWPDPDRAGLVADVVAAAGEHPEYAVARRLAAYYPGDVGVVVALLLNFVTLQPGEGIWMPAGNLHAYLRGTGVEIMAASDNVLRGGLTPKHVDVPELLRVLVFEPLPDPVLRPVRLAGGEGWSVDTWPVPIEDFALRRVTLTGAAVRLDPVGPRTLLCLSGEVVVADRAGSVDLKPGFAAFGNADAGQLELTGAGEVFLAEVSQPRG